MNVNRNEVAEVLEAQAALAVGSGAQSFSLRFRGVCWPVNLRALKQGTGATGATGAFDSPAGEGNQ